MAKKMSTPKIKVQSIDDQLTNHLREAENHLIAAVKLFARKAPPERHKDYLPRLVRAQEGVTTLLREELIRIRGPLRAARKAAKK
jgi:hypothetical protein